MRFLAVSNGRARSFRYSALRLFDGPSAIVFDRETFGTVSSSERLETRPFDEFVRRRGREWWTEDASADVRLRDVTVHSPYRAYVGVALHRQDEVAGVLCHFDERPVVFSGDESEELRHAAVDLSEWLAHVDWNVDGPELSAVDVGSALSQERAIRHGLEKQRRHLRQLLLSAPSAIAVWSGPEHICELANAAFQRQLIEPRDITGLPIREALSRLSPDDPVFDIVEAAYRSGLPYLDPEYCAEAWVDGVLTEQFFCFDIIPTHDLDGHVEGLLTCSVNVTDAVRARLSAKQECDRANALAAREVAARERAEEMHGRAEFLLDVAGSLGEGLELESILQRLVETIAPRRADFASVWKLDDEGLLRRLTFAPRNQTIARVANVHSSARRFASGHPARRTLDTNQMIVMDDFSTLLDDPESTEQVELAKELGLSRAVFVPIFVGTRAEAVLVVARRESWPFDEDDKRLFRAVARQTALAFQNARLFAETQEFRLLAEHSALVKDQFLAKVSHDLRNPVSTILGWLRVLKEDRANADRLDKAIDVIERNALAQVQLIEDLLDISRIAVGKLKLELAIEDVHTAIDMALDPARLAAHAKGVALRVDVASDVGCIAVDPHRFRQVLWNLASNAVKFTPHGGKVEVHARRAGSAVEIEVRDDGRGIAPEFMPHVFEKFEQADTQSASTAGLGLGLAIVRNLVELHGGTVSVASGGLGKGACFTVRIPIRAAVASRTDEEDGGTGGVLRGRRVLVVDDDPDAREVVAIILQGAAASVEVASSVDEAFDAFRRRPPDAVVSDVGMSTLDGTELVRRIRALPHEALRGVPIVALTARARPEDRRQSLAAGFTCHLTKPVQPTELVQWLTELVALHVGSAR